MLPAEEMPSNESYLVFFRPSWVAFAFIFPMNDLVRAAVVVPVPKVSASAYAASQPEGSISADSS